MEESQDVDSFCGLIHLIDHDIVFDDRFSKSE